MQLPVAPQANTHGNTSSPKKKSLKPTQLVTGIAMILVALLLVVALFMFVLGGSSNSSKVKKGQYQAVFLNSQDGQVYFGKLSTENTDYYRLTDIYYVRVEQRIQPEGQNAQTPQQNISLAKLGNELHGPEDEMFIRKDKVLFWENLKEDGQVVRAIREFQKNPDAANQNNQQNTQQQNQAQTQSSTSVQQQTTSTTNR